MKMKQEIKRYARKVKGKLTTVFAPEHLEALARQSEFAQCIAVCSKERRHRMRQHPCLHRCAYTRSPVHTCQGHRQRHQVRRPIYYKHVVPLYGPVETFSRVHSFAHAV